MSRRTRTSTTRWAARETSSERVLVRLVTHYSRGSQDLAPGAVLDLQASEAEFLIEEGVAVPVTDKDTTSGERR
jgi:hypothetical protein